MFKFTYIFVLLPFVFFSLATSAELRQSDTSSLFPSEPIDKESNLDTGTNIPQQDENNIEQNIDLSQLPAALRDLFVMIDQQKQLFMDREQQLLGEIKFYQDLQEKSTDYAESKQHMQHLFSLEQHLQNLRDKRQQLQLQREQLEANIEKLHTAIPTEKPYE